MPQELSGEALVELSEGVNTLRGSLMPPQSSIVFGAVYTITSFISTIAPAGDFITYTLPMMADSKR